MHGVLGVTFPHMTLAEILSNEELRQHEFPVVREKAYLAHAGVCPLPRRVRDAISAYADTCMTDDQEEAMPARLISETRVLAARILNAKPEEIALVGPTSLALSFIAQGMRWVKGDNMIVYFDDYPSNVYPWMDLANRGVEVRLVRVRDWGRVRKADVLGQADENTRLVALASCHFVTGYRLDYQAIGRSLRSRNILFCLDGIQTVGAFPMPVNHVDFLAADAHKWILGPCAAGLLYVRQPVQARLLPAALGWHNVRCPNFAAQEKMEFLPDARRYEAGTPNLMGIAGLRAALELLLEIGIEPIATELLRKRAWLIPALQAKGWDVIEAAAPPENASGIVTFDRPGADMAAVHRRLLESAIVTSLRADRTGRQFVRLSPHFYNTDAELHRMLEACSA